MKKNLYASVAFGALLAVSTMPGCAQFENYAKADRDANLEFQDARDAFAPREVPPTGPDAQAANGVPEFQDYTATSIADMKSMPLVTISVNETIPLKDVLYELANQANYDLELDSRIQGAVIFSAKNRPFDEVMARISDMAGLRYTFKDTHIRVEMDTPYSKTYKVNYSMMPRDVTSTMTTGSSGGSSGGASGGSSSGGESGGTSGGSQGAASSFSVNSSTKVDFWADVDKSLRDIMTNNAVGNTLSSGYTPVVAAAASSDPSAVPPLPPEAMGGLPNAMPITSPTVPVTATAPAPVGSSATSSAAAATSAPAEGDTTVGNYSINKQAGMITVYANDRVQRLVGTYLDSLQKQVGAQVLVEAKILKVELNDDYATGIDWSNIGMPGDLQLDMDFSDTVQAGGVALTYSSSNLTALLQAVSKYGTVRGLASPRLTVLNNQSAILSVVQNNIYFNIEIEVEDEVRDDSGNITTPQKTTYTSTPNTSVEGVMINVTPSINTDTGEIMMMVRPTVTKELDRVNDPGFELATGGNLVDGDNNPIHSEYPIMKVEEFDSILKLKSGDVAVLGGLLNDEAENTQEAVPIAGEIPLFGNLFRKHNDTNKKTELIVLLRATIVNKASDGIHQTDRDLFKTFGQDRRPFPM